MPANALVIWDLEQINPGDRPSPDNAGGLIITAMDIEPAIEEEFNDWYNTEHIPILSKLPGMLAAALWSYGDFVFTPGWDIMSDMTKARQFGFSRSVRTVSEFIRYFDHFRSIGVLPK